MYTCIITDDQAEAVDLIKDHLQKVPQLSLLFSTTDPVETVAFLESNKPDIIFLDIEMPGLTGIELIENLKARWGNNIPKIVLTTGYSDYALSGYEYGVVDYLLKPVSFNRFKKCADRIIDELDKRTSPLNKPAFLFVEENGKKIKINFNEIDYIEGAGNYILLVTHEGRKIIYRTMNAMQEILPSDSFIRVHKSYIIAIENVKAIRGNEILIIANGTEKMVPIGITYREAVLKILGL